MQNSHRLRIKSTVALVDGAGDGEGAGVPAVDAGEPAVLADPGDPDDPGDP